MRHAGALRIDHILGLKRLFWIPRDGGPKDGVYVEYPFEEMLDVVSRSYEDRPDREQYSTPARPEERVCQTFCGT